MIWNGDTGFEVGYKGDTYVVDLKNKSCPCRSWNLTGIPCPHAIFAIHHLEKNPEDFVHEVYRKNAYKVAYAQMIESMNSKKFWQKREIDPPRPPPDRRMPGRPAKNRKKEEGEYGSTGSKLCRKGRKITCQMCYQQGHNKQTCPQKEKVPEQGINNTGPIGEAEVEMQQVRLCYILNV